MARAASATWRRLAGIAFGAEPAGPLGTGPPGLTDGPTGVTVGTAELLRGGPPCCIKSGLIVGATGHTGGGALGLVVIAPFACNGMSGVGTVDGSAGPKGETTATGRGGHAAADGKGTNTVGDAFPNGDLVGPVERPRVITKWVGSGVTK